MEPSLKFNGVKIEIYNGSEIPLNVLMGFVLARWAIWSYEQMTTVMLLKNLCVEKF